MEQAETPHIWCLLQAVPYLFGRSAL